MQHVQTYQAIIYVNVFRDLLLIKLLSNQIHVMILTSASLIHVIQVMFQVHFQVHFLIQSFANPLKPFQSTTCFNYIGSFDCACDPDQTSNDSPYVETSRYIYASNGLRTPDQVHFQFRHSNRNPA